MNGMADPLGGPSAVPDLRTLAVSAQPQGAPVLPSPPVDAVISIQNLTKSFGSHTVLRDITFDVPRGAITAVLGPSGTGKSVLLKVIIGLLKPDNGGVYIDGELMSGLSQKDLFRIRRKFGVLFQDGALFGSMNLYENIAFPFVSTPRRTKGTSERSCTRMPSWSGSWTTFASFPARCRAV